MDAAFTALSGARHATAAVPLQPQLVVASPPSTGPLAPAACGANTSVPGIGSALSLAAGAAVAALAWQRREHRSKAVRRAKVTARRAAAGATAPSEGREPGATQRRSVATAVDIAPPEIDFDDGAQAAPKPKYEHKQFDWFSAWYPVHVIDIMDPGRPHKTQLLGINIVIWNDGPTVNGEKQLGKWHVFEDACPHRQAPLSEGRIEDDGSLLCSYHAWRFNGEGECTSLPYSPEHLEEKHKCSCRAKCTAFPTREEDGLLFVWPDASPKGHEECKLKEPQLIEELHDPELSKKWIKFPINLRDLELGWDVFFENAMDPSHFLVAHHNITGNRYTDPKWFAMKPERPLDTENGVAVRGIPGCFDYRPPCLVKNQQDGGVIFAIYNTPTSPGHCRHIGFLVLDTESIAGDSGVVDKDAVQLFTGPVPIWLQHLLTSFFLHQDAVLLHHQEQNFRDRGFEAKPDSEVQFKDVSYTPTEVDIGSIQFRRWLRTRAGGGVPWKCDPTLPPRLMSNEKIFDVWGSHTKHCRYCRDAYNNINMLKNGAFGAAFTAALAMGDGPERIAAGAVACGTGLALQKLADLFEVYEFNHQDNK